MLSFTDFKAMSYIFNWWAVVSRNINEGETKGHEIEGEIKRNEGRCRRETPGNEGKCMRNAREKDKEMRGPSIEMQGKCSGNKGDIKGT